MPPAFGKILIVMGLFIVILGVLMLLGPRIPWLGRLPGDIHLRGGRWSVYIPLATSILLSIVLTILLNIFPRR